MSMQQIEFVQGWRISHGVLKEVVVPRLVFEDAEKEFFYCFDSGRGFGDSRGLYIQRKEFLLEKPCRERVRREKLAFLTYEMRNAQSSAESLQYYIDLHEREREKHAAEQQEYLRKRDRLAAKITRLKRMLGDTEEGSER